MSFMSIKSLANLRGTCDILKTLVEEHMPRILVNLVHSNVNENNSVLDDYYLIKIEFIRENAAQKLESCKSWGECSMCGNLLFKKKDNSCPMKLCLEPLCLFKSYMEVRYEMCVCSAQEKCIRQKHFKVAFPFLCL